MKFLKQHPGFRIVSLCTTSLLCVLLTCVTTQKAVSNGLWKKPSVVLQASTTLITYPCPPNASSNSGSCPPTADLQVALTAVAKDFAKQTFYSYTVTGGRVVGEGSKVIWDVTEAGPGTHTATVEVQDHKKHRAVSSVIVKIVNCPDCVPTCFLCPTIVVTCYDEVKAGTLAVCKVMMGPTPDRVTYVWSVNASSEEDLSGRISARGKSIFIPTNGLGGQAVNVKVELKGLDPSCGATASSSMVVKP